MPVAHADPVSVTVGDGGEPEAFVWNRFEYFATGIPQRFYRRRGSWWRQPSTINGLDVELWRVEAAMLGDQARLFDLRHDAGAWFLELEWE